LDFRAVGGSAAGGSEGPLFAKLFASRPENTAAVAAA